MQRRLIGEGTAQHRVVIGVVGDHKPREPGRPALVEVAPDANFVDRHLSSSRDVSDACAALPSVCSSTRQVVMYQRMCCWVDFFSQAEREGGRLFVTLERSKRRTRRAGVMLSLEQLPGVGACDRLGAAGHAEI